MVLNYKSSVDREVNDIIHKDLRSIIGYSVGEIPQGKKKPSLEIWIKKEMEELRYAAFGKTIVFTDMHDWYLPN